MSYSGPSHSAAHANAQSKGPNKLYCNGCKKDKPIQSFSQTQIDKASKYLLLWLIH